MKLQTIFLIERKNQFSHKKLIFPNSVCDFRVKIDFSSVKNLIADSISLSCGMKIGTCAFGILFDYFDENNFCGVFISDYDYACVVKMKNDNLEFLQNWEKISERKKHKVRISRAPCRTSIKIDGKLFYSRDTRSEKEIFEDGNDYPTDFSKAEIHLACQNYIVHEKVSAKFVLSSCKLACKNFACKDTICNGAVCEGLGNEEILTLKNGLHENAEKNPVTNEDSAQAWKFYEEARKNYILGNIKNARSQIFAAATDLSENLAVLELYAFILKEESEEECERAIRLIESNIKHAPYVEEYRTEARNLISRLRADCNQNANCADHTACESNLKFSLQNRAIFFLEKPVIPMYN